MKDGIVCCNCGAEMEKDSSRCPYCNAINEIGAEKQYKRQLGELKEDLEDLSQVPENAYKKEMLVTWKRAAAITIAVMTVLAAALGITFLHRRAEERYFETDIKKQLLWEAENFPKFDAWYEAGDYDAIVEAQEQAYEEGFHIWDWEHGRFISAYEGYRYCIEARERLKSKEGANEDLAQYVLGEVMLLLFFLKEEGYAEEDWQIMQSWAPELEAILYEDMKFTEEETAELYEKINKDGYIDYDACDKYASEIWKRFIQ